VSIEGEKAVLPLIVLPIDVAAWICWAIDPEEPMAAVIQWHEGKTWLWATDRKRVHMAFLGKTKEHEPIWICLREIVALATVVAPLMDLVFDQHGKVFCSPRSKGERIAIHHPLIAEGPPKTLDVFPLLPARTGPPEAFEINPGYLSEALDNPFVNCTFPQRVVLYGTKYDKPVLLTDGDEEPRWMALIMPLGTKPYVGVHESLPSAQGRGEGMILYEANADGTKGRRVGEVYFSRAVNSHVSERTTPWQKGHQVETRKIIVTPAKSEREALNELMAHDLMAVQE